MGRQGSTDHQAHTFLLPDVEQQALYNAANFSIACKSDATGSVMNWSVIVTRVNAFLCPSDNTPGWNSVENAPLNLYRATGNNYFASYGSGIEWLSTETGGPPNGMFQVTGTCFGLQSITDGSTNTIAFGEWRTGSGNLRRSRQRRTLFSWAAPPAGTSRSAAGTEIMPALNSLGFQAWITHYAQSVATVRCTFTPVVGEAWGYGLLGYSMGSTLLPPNSPYPNCSAGAANTFDAAGMFNMTSLHPGGANILMSDGSVRFLKNSVSMPIVWALGSRARRDHLLRLLLNTPHLPGTSCVWIEVSWPGHGSLIIMMTLRKISIICLNTRP